MSVRNIIFMKGYNLMNKKYKKIVIILSFVLIVTIGVNIFTYAYTGKNVWDFFGGDSQNDMMYLMEKYGQQQVYISPIAVKIFSTETINTESIEILYKDGTKEEVVNVEKRIGLGSSSQSYTLSENTETYIFSDLKDIEQIESIIYNGEKTVK